MPFREVCDFACWSVMEPSVANIPLDTGVKGVPGSFIDLKSDNT